MRVISAAFQAHLNSGATTICTCWRIAPRHGEALGFTDHDQPLSFDGLTFEAASGFTASGVEHALGLSIDNAVATGALISDRISEADIARGRFDGAEVTQWQVNWADASQRVILFHGELGEIQRGDLAFEAELRGISERLNRPVGRSFLPVCDAVLGDARCKFDLSSAGMRGAGVVETVIDARVFTASGLADFDAGWFAYGALTWSTGDNAGLSNKVVSHRVTGGLVEIRLERGVVGGPEVGDAFAVAAGCDKRMATCRDKFRNLVNFRGFPTMPGENWLTTYPVDGAAYQGGSRHG